MCIENVNSTKIKEYFRSVKRRIYFYTRDIWCCYKYRKRKTSDFTPSFYNPYYDPNFVELKEVVVVPNNQIVNTQPHSTFFNDSSDDEIIFQKENNKHIVEINEDNTFNKLFNKEEQEDLTYEHNLSDIPEDIDSSMERITPTSPALKPNIFITSPVDRNMFFDDLEEELTQKNLSKSSVSIKSVNVGSSDEDNWDLLEN